MIKGNEDIFWYMKLNYKSLSLLVNLKLIASSLRTQGEEIKSAGGIQLC